MFNELLTRKLQSGLSSNRLQMKLTQKVLSGSCSHESDPMFPVLLVPHVLVSVSLKRCNAYELCTHHSNLPHLQA